MCVCVREGVCVCVCERDSLCVCACECVSVMGGKCRDREEERRERHDELRIC